MVQIDAAVLCRDVNRGETLHEEDCLVEERWVGPFQASTHCSLIEAVGRVADAPLKAGDVLKKKYFKREMLVKRGDRVVVRCLVGGVVISMEAEARGDGVEGEKVELRKIGERATFFGTVAGPGSVIVDLAR
jgi:flagella basal body P-ring formation protein FlgA